MTKISLHFITLFPETIETWLESSILGRARANGLFSSRTYQLRDFSNDKHKSVDDAAYGGGGGMVLRLEPLVAAVESIRNAVGPENTTVIYFSPAGERINQALIQQARQDYANRHLIFICGHYEGVDERFIEGWVDRQLSLGDFVLTGGELPAVAFADALIRQFEGALGNEESSRHESFLIGHPHKLLEYPHYTRPSEFRGRKVPDVLLNGNHSKIEEWRLNQALEKTRRARPDLLDT